MKLNKTLKLLAHLSYGIRTRFASANAPDVSHYSMPPNAENYSTRESLTHGFTHGFAMFSFLSSTRYINIFRKRMTIHDALDHSWLAEDHPDFTHRIPSSRYKQIRNRIQQKYVWPPK